MVTERVDTGLDDEADAGLAALPDAPEDVSDTAVDGSESDAASAGGTPPSRDDEIRRAANRIVRERERQFERDFRKAVNDRDAQAIEALRRDRRWAKVWDAHQSAVAAARPAPEANTQEAQAMRVLDELDRLRETNPAAYFQYLDENRQQVEHWTGVRAQRRQAEQRAKAELERTRPPQNAALERTFDRLMESPRAAVLTDADRDELERLTEGDGDPADLSDRFAELVLARQHGERPRPSTAERARAAGARQAPVGGAPARRSGANPMAALAEARRNGTVTPAMKAAAAQYLAQQRGQ